MSRVAAIDLGTHNCRLLIAERFGDAFRVIRAQAIIVRLGEGAARAGALQPAAIQRTIAALKRFAEIIADEGAGEVHAVATEACRMADNCEVFFETILVETGLRFEVIPAREEVRLAVLASAPLISAARVVMIDIGGGSSEIILLNSAGGTLEVSDWVSLPLGVVRGRDAMASAEVTGEEFAALIAANRQAMAGFFAKNKTFFDLPFEVIGTSGTVTSLAALALGLETYQRAKVDGATLAQGDLLRLARETALLPLKARADNAVIGPERAEFMVPGCAIFSAIFSFIDVATLTAADRGLREGILNSLLPGAPDVVFSGQGG